METVPGWGEPLDDCVTIDDLPEAARAYVRLSSSPSTCRSGSSEREPRGSTCSQRRDSGLDHLPGIDVDVVDLPRSASEEEPFGVKRSAISVASPFSVSALTVPISCSAGRPGDHDFVGSPMGSRSSERWRPEASV